MTKVIRIDVHANTPATIVIGHKSKISATSLPMQEPKKEYKPRPVDPTFVFTATHNDILVLLNRFGKKKLYLQGLNHITQIFNEYFDLYVPSYALKNQADLLWEQKHPMWKKGSEPIKVWRSLRQEFYKLADTLEWVEPNDGEAPKMKVYNADGTVKASGIATNATASNGMASNGIATNGIATNGNGIEAEKVEENRSEHTAGGANGKGKKKDQKGTGSRANQKANIKVAYSSGPAW